MLLLAATRGPALTLTRRCQCAEPASWLQRVQAEQLLIIRDVLWAKVFCICTTATFNINMLGFSTACMLTHGR